MGGRTLPISALSPTSKAFKLAVWKFKLMLIKRWNFTEVLMRMTVYIKGNVQILLFISDPRTLGQAWYWREILSKSVADDNNHRRDILRHYHPSWYMGSLLVAGAGGCLGYMEKVGIRGIRGARGSKIWERQWGGGWNTIYEEHEFFRKGN